MIEDVKLAVEKRRRKQIQINAYHRTFGTPDGKIVLAQLLEQFRFDRPTFVKVAGKYCPIEAAIRDGNREIYLHILEFLKLPVDGDANINTAKPAVKAE